MSLAAPVRPHSAPSATDARDMLVDALTEAGFHATPAAPDSPTAGAAWPQWTGTAFNGVLCNPSVFSFSVYLVLGAGDATTTVLAGDDAVSRATPALGKVASVAAAEPVLITFGDSTSMPGVRVRVSLKGR